MSSIKMNVDQTNKIFLLEKLSLLHIFLRQKVQEYKNQSFQF